MAGQDVPGSSRGHHPAPCWALTAARLPLRHCPPQIPPSCQRCLFSALILQLFRQRELSAAFWADRWRLWLSVAAPVTGKMLKT